MPLLNSFVIWNNKGGVGKTTLTFHMSTDYAIRHPKQKILVIDLCPQANVSMALLKLFGTKKLTRVPAEKSISSYLHQVTNLKPLSVIDPQDFLIEVSDYNWNIPPNVFLLRGDVVNLELMALFSGAEKTEGDLKRVDCLLQSLGIHHVLCTLFHRGFWKDGRGSDRSIQWLGCVYRH